MSVGEIRLLMLVSVLLGFALGYAWKWLVTEIHRIAREGL